MVLEAGSPRSMCQPILPNSGFGECFFLAYRWLATFSLCPHRAFSWSIYMELKRMRGRERERERERDFVLFFSRTGV
jgi:hypothetical protein